MALLEVEEEKIALDNLLTQSSKWYMYFISLNIHPYVQAQTPKPVAAGESASVGHLRSEECHHGGMTDSGLRFHASVLWSSPFIPRTCFGNAGNTLSELHIQVA